MKNKKNVALFGNDLISIRTLVIFILIISAFGSALFYSGMVEIIRADTNIGSVPAGTNPFAVAVNPITNKIYLANQNSNNVTVIDGTNNSTQTVAAGTIPLAVAVNPVTNKIYVANQSSNNVTVIDGTNNSTQTVAPGTVPLAVAVNPVTNKIYVANQNSANVTVIDGTNNSTQTVAAGSVPRAVAVNPVINKIYVANQFSANVTVIDGTNNSTQTVAAGTNPFAVAVNPVANKIYVTNQNSANVTVIDGTNNSTQTVAAGSGPRAVAVNPVTNKIYVANQSTANVTVITPAATSAVPLNTTVGAFPNNTAPNPTPVFEFTATSTYSPNTPPPTNIYFQIDTANGEWTRATPTGSTATTLSATGTAPMLQSGMHTVYFFATDGSEATSINPLIERYDPFHGFPMIFEKGREQLSPESAPVIGGINAMHFLVPALGPTAANVSVAGRVLTSTGRGISRAIVSITDATGEIRYARTNHFGYFRFNDIGVGETYIFNASAKGYTFATQVLNVQENIQGLNFTAQ